MPSSPDPSHHSEPAPSTQPVASPEQHTEAEPETPDAVPASVAAEQAHEPVPLRRNRDYQLLIGGSTVAMLGNGMMSLGLMLLTTALTGSAAKAGLVSGAFGLGMWLATLPAGALCDRWNRKAIMVATSLVGAALMATVPLADLAGALTFPHLVVVGLVLGVLGCFYSPAESAAIKRIVPAEQMGQALSINQARSSLGLLVGSPAAAALFAVTRALPMAVNAATYVVGAVCAALVRTPLPAPEREGAQGEDARTVVRQVASDMVTGLRWVWRARAVRDMVLAGMVINLGLNGMFTISLLSLQLGGTDPRALGLMDSAVGVVGLVAALGAPWVLGRARVGTIAVSAMGALALTAWLLPVHLSVWWVGGVLAFAEIALVPLNAGIGAYRIHVTPDVMQGRSLAAAQFLTLAMMPVANAGAGFLLEGLGRVPAMVVFALALTAGCLGCAASRPIRSMPATKDFASVPEIPAR